MRPLFVVAMLSFALGGVLMALGSRRLAQAQRQARWTKFAVYFAIVMSMLLAARLGRVALALVVLAILAQGARELAAALAARAGPQRRFRVGCWAGYGALAAAAGMGLATLSPAAVAFAYVVVAAFDGFSQTVGQWLGRRRLAPRLSPGKTVEGAAGGLAAAILVAFLLRQLWPAAPLQAAAIGAGLAVAALAGDLAASYVKRRCGIKDYGAVLPGHGGVLDRFDGFLPALALAGALAGR